MRVRNKDKKEMHKEKENLNENEPQKKHVTIIEYKNQKKH